MQNFSQVKNKEKINFHAIKIIDVMLLCVESSTHFNQKTVKLDNNLLRKTKRTHHSIDSSCLISGSTASVSTSSTAVL